MVCHGSQKSRTATTIAIVGAGPAGVSAAFTLSQVLANSRKKFHIHLYDLSHAPDSSNIADNAVGHVEALISTGDIVLEQAQPCSGSCCDQLVSTNHQQLLGKAIASGVQVHFGWQLLAASRAQSKFKLNFKCPDACVHSVKADFVVDATGKASKFAEHMGASRDIIDEAVYVRAFIDNYQSLTNDDNGFVEAVEPGWWYVANMPDDKLMVSLCTDQKHIQAHHYDDPIRWLQLLKKTAWISKKVPDSLLCASASQINVQIQDEPSSMLSEFHGSGWLAVGDAACCYDPISSSGLVKAIRQGACAGKAVARYLSEQSELPLTEYDQHVLTDLNHHLGVGNPLHVHNSCFEQAQFWYRCFSE